MQIILLENYLWLKAFHLIAVMSWMAGLLYLPRLFVYHAEEKTKATQKTLAVMEHRLLRYIMNPAMIATWVLGITLVYANPEIFSGGWMHAKFTLVILLSVFHMACSKWRKSLAADTSTKSPKFFRVANEVPTLLMIAIVILVIVKPF